MANGYLGDKAVQLPNMFQSPGQALANRINDINQSNERQFELDYRHQKDKEAEDWKKLNLIQDLTDLSKYHTGSDVADAIGFNKMNEVYQKYTAAAGQMSPAELQARIQKEMAGVVNGMNATREELNLADEQLKVLKQKYPSLDVANLGKDYREEILQRRIKGDNFENPLTVGQSTFDIQNPDKLAKYITGNTKLTETIQNPKGGETFKVFKGSPSAYTEYTAKVNPWKTENFDRGKLRGGFMTTSGEPKLEIKAKPLPGAATNDGQPFMVMDDDIYKKFSEDEAINLELTAATRNKFKDYDNLSPDQKNIAKRNTLYDKIKELDPSDYYPSDVKAAPVYHNRTSINTPRDITINDVAGDIANEVDKVGGTAVASTLSNGDIIWADAKKRGFEAETPDDIKVVRRDGDTFVQVTYKKNKKDKDGNDLVQDGYYVKEKTTAEYKLNSKKINIENTPGVGNKTGVIKNENSPKSGMVRVKLASGQVGDIPADKIDQFLKENKGATRQ